MLSPVLWHENAVRCLDQTLLPGEERWIDLHSVEELAQAIRRLAIRGAPAIGIAAAFGCALAANQYAGNDPQELYSEVKQAIQALAATRPTAVNLFWALKRMERTLENATTLPLDSIRQRLLDEAQQIRIEDIESCQAIGRFGAKLMPEKGGVLTHCNAGALATGGFGTALGVIRAAVQSGKNFRVFVDETRPLLQGARLTTWELLKDGIDVTLICDNMAGSLMRQGKIDACVVGADRIAANGDTANKIGTYSLAVLARRHGIPFYIAAPFSSIDLSLTSGDEIPIEERDPAEVTSPRGQLWAPSEVLVYNPAFDVTPASLIHAIITDRGIASSPNLGEHLKNLALING